MNQQADKKILFLRFASFYSEKFAHPENVMAPVDMAIIITIARELGYEIDIIDTEAFSYTEGQLLDKIKAFSPDFVIVKAKTPTLLQLLKISKQLDGVSLIGIGQAFHGNHQNYLFPGSNFIASIQGEPEMKAKELLDALKHHRPLSQVKGITYLDDDGKIASNPAPATLVDLDELPMPAFEHFIGKEYHSYYPTPLFMKKRQGFMLSSRGCPYPCVFCSPTLRNSESTKLRFHSNDRVIREILYLKKLGITFIQFRDDLFTGDRERTMSLCKEIVRRKVKISWACQTNINNVDEELLTWMAKAGCVSMGFGIESGSKAVLKTLRKNNDIDSAPRLFKHCRKVGIKTVAFFLIGNPGETRDDLEQSYELLKKIRPDLIQVAFFTPYQGSPAYELYKTPSDMRENPHHYNTTSAYGLVPVDELKSFQKKMYFYCIFSWPNVFKTASRLASELVVNPYLARKLLMKGGNYLFLSK
ncbi:MAG: radical SAM protein [Elusimicrobiota bacterium]|nr:radical SAM protein [Elusimicrobiota bacterium]